jgi:two-component system cell cycle response regulator
VVPPPGAQREDVSLLVLRGPDLGRRFPLTPPGGVIGRQQDCAIPLRDPNISRRHALIELTDGRVMLSDLGSRNGVFVNGARVSRSEIFDGNDIQLSSDSVLRVRFQDPNEAKLLDDLYGAVVTDGVTGVSNRRYLENRLAQELSYTRRHESPCCVALIDVDGFSQVVATDGQTGGDALLRAIAELICGSSRLEDDVARFGDHQLAVILRSATAEQGAVFGERVCQLVRERVFDVGEVAIRATVSIGVASFEPGRFDVKEAAELLDRADTALYRAKSSGKDRVACLEGGFEAGDGQL